MRTALSVLVTALALVTAPQASAATSTDLTIEVTDPLASIPIRTYHLTCDPDGGTHPKPEAACDAIRKSPGTIKPVPGTAACLDIDYGPQRATVTGLLYGEKVSSTFRRINSCEQERWQAWLPVWG